MHWKQRGENSLSEEYRKKKEKLQKSKDIRNWYLGFMKNYPNGQRGEKDKFSVNQDHEKRQQDTYIFGVLEKPFLK